MASFRMLFMTSCLTVAMANIFTSSYKTSQMAMQEDRILSKLKEHIDEQHERIRQLTDTYLKLSHEARMRVTSRVADDMKHPNAVYHVIKRFALHYVDQLGGEIFDTIRNKLQTDPDPITIAVEEDFNGALDGLLRLQDIYNLTVNDMVSGNYRGHLGPLLAFQDAFCIAQRAYSAGRHDVAIKWLETSLQLRQKDPAVAKNSRLFPTKGAIKGLLGRALILLKDIERAESLYMEGYEDDPASGDVNVLGVELKTRPVLSIPTITESRANYSRLCSYNDTFHIELARGTIGTDNDKQLSSIRTSDVGWLKDQDNFQTASLSTRIGLITGLSVAESHPSQHPIRYSGEQFQVVNYGLAGHYDVHVDPFDEPDNSGHRIATFLVYLNTVEEGGNTVFTKAGISVAARSGTVLFWYSFQPSFDKVDDLTHHAGCPVLIGQKWIANKWIRSYGNTYQRPCGLSPSSTQLDMEKVMDQHLRNIHAL